MSNLPQEDYDYAEVIGRNLQRLINERGTTQAAIAQKLGIARSGINKYAVSYTHLRAHETTLHLV